jgi:nickel/cobalt exporter
VFFYAKSHLSLTRINEPFTFLSDIRFGGLANLVAGVLVIGLGIGESRHDHSHDRADGDHSHHYESRDHESTKHSSHGHSHGDIHDHQGLQDDKGLGSRLNRTLRFIGTHSHTQERSDDVDERELLGIAWFACLLGFTLEVELKTIAPCAGSNHSLELLRASAITPIVAIGGRW